MIRKNLYIVVLLLCSFTNLSAQNESSQFEQDLELIGLNFSLSDQYDLSDNMRMIYVTDDYKSPLRRLGTVHSILKNHDGQCNIFVYLSGANGLRYGGIIRKNKSLFKNVSSLTYNRIKTDFKYGYPGATEQDIEDLKMMMTFYPHDTATVLFNADYMMVYPFNMEGKKYQDKFTRTRVVVTGKDGLDVLNDFPFDGYITLNGQYCYTNDQIIYSNTIKKEDLQALLDYLEDHQVPCGFTEENTKYFNYRDKRVDAIHAITHNDDHPAGDCSHVIDKSIYQIMCFVDEKEEKEILSHMPHCISARWHPTFCDISPIGGTKQLGIDQFLEYYGLDLKDTMAFGDGGNDKQMLQHVSLAIAMGNAGDELKSIADFVTKDVDDDGVAYALKHYGLIDL